MNQVSKNIRTLRKEKGMTQDDLAEKLHVTRQTVSNYETGKSMPDIELLTQIAEALDADINALIYGRRNQSPIKISTSIFKLAISLGPLCFWLLLTDILTPVLMQYKHELFLISPYMIYTVFINPLLQIYIGWNIPKAFSTIFPQFKPIRTKTSCRVCAILLFAIAILFINIGITFAPLFFDLDSYIVKPLISINTITMLLKSSWIFISFGIALWILRLPKSRIPEEVLPVIVRALYTLLFGLILWMYHPIFQAFEGKGYGLYPYSVFYTLLLPVFLLIVGWLFMDILSLFPISVPVLHKKACRILKGSLLAVTLLILCNAFALSGHFILGAYKTFSLGGTHFTVDNFTVLQYQQKVPFLYKYLIPHTTLMTLPFYLFYSLTGFLLHWPVEKEAK